MKHAHMHACTHARTYTCNMFARFDHQKLLLFQNFSLAEKHSFSQHFQFIIKKAEEYQNKRIKQKIDHLNQKKNINKEASEEPTEEEKHIQGRALSAKQKEKELIYEWKNTAGKNLKPDPAAAKILFKIKHMTSIPTFHDPDVKEHHEREGLKGMSNEWFALIHKPISYKKAMEIDDARKAINKEWEKLEGYPA